MVRERNELYRRANEDIILELLSVLDHLDLALEAADTHKAQGAFVEGLRLVSDQMLSVLGKFGLAPVDAEGQPFDPAVHEAMAQVADESLPANSVVQVFEKGYQLKERMLRPARVTVSKAASKQQEGSQ